MPLDNTTRQDIVAHMNSDHANAVLDYVRGIAQMLDVTSARLVDIDEQGMLIETQNDTTRALGHRRKC